MNSLGSAGVNSIMFVASVGIETDPGWWNGGNQKSLGSALAESMYFERLDPPDRYSVFNNTAYQWLRSRVSHTFGGSKWHAAVQ